MAAVEFALRADTRYLAARAEVANLPIELTSGATIDQAKGLVMGEHQISGEQVFALLAEYSQRFNIKVREVAGRLLTTVTTLLKSTLQLTRPRSEAKPAERGGQSSSPAATLGGAGTGTRL